MKIYRGNGDVVKMVNIADPEDTENPNNFDWVKLEEATLHRNFTVDSATRDMENLFSVAIIRTFSLGTKECTRVIAEYNTLKERQEEVLKMLKGEGAEKEGEL